MIPFFAYIILEIDLDESSIKILEKLGFEFEMNFFVDQTKAAKYVIRR